LTSNCVLNISKFLTSRMNFCNTSSHWRKSDWQILFPYSCYSSREDGVGKTVKLNYVIYEFASAETRKFTLNLQLYMKNRVSRGSSVSIVSVYGPDGRGSILDRGRGFLL
jgi:hypothetical protein